MNLHENSTIFRQAIQATADQMNIPAIYVEKDYWVTYALYTIFKSDVGQDAVFKGGTALSKCFNVIERFSEDIDLVVLRHEGETDGQMKAKIRKVSKIIEPVLPEVEVPGLTTKMGMNRKTAHSYSKNFAGDFGQVRDIIVLETTWLGSFEPFTSRHINSFLGEMMLRNGQEKLAESFGLIPFKIQVLEPVRTICEKIMSLVRFSYGTDPIDDLKRKVRHLYDLHQLLQQKEYVSFFKSKEFDNMLLKVASDDVISYRNNNQWLANHPKDALVFAKLDEVWKELEPIMKGDFKNLVYGKLPDTKDVLNTMRMIKERLGSVNWTIQVEK